MPASNSLWSVSLLLDEADAGPMSGAIPWPLEDVRELRIGSVPGVSDLPSMTVELRASSAEMAEDRARSIARQIRRAAGLPDAILPLAWVAPLKEDEASSNRFLDQASELLESEFFELAVVAAQIHLELQLRVLLRRAVEALGSPRWAQRLLVTRGLTTLGNDLSYAIVELLLGVDVTQLPEWTRFPAHLKRRQAIIHEGQAVGEKDAAESVEVVRNLWTRLTEEVRKGDS